MRRLRCAGLVRPAWRVLASASLLLAASVPASAVAAPASSSDLAPVQSGLDYHSFANIEQFRITKLEIDLRVDSDAKLLRGVVGLMVKRLDPGATELILDTRDLNITEVAEKAQGVLGALSKTETTWVSRPFHFERKDPILGQALVIELPPSKKATEFIRIAYETGPGAPGLQWIAAARTAGRHQPFLVTRSAPIGARSWIPLQDTPAVRFTYIATVHTSPEVLAVMTARNDPKVKRNGEYAFVMLDAIPSCELGLVVGDLKFQETGPRSGVYAERPLLKGAAKEFADAPAWLEAAEKIAGPYQWERFDTVVVPGEFPVPELGLPRVAFVSSTVLTGDKSDVSAAVLALAQSWAGALVGNTAWRDAWVNEALADYLRTRIMSAVYGERREAMEHAARVRTLGGPVLAPDLRGKDPAAALTVDAADKGGLLMQWLEAKFGSEQLDAFLKGYFAQYALKSVTTEQFVNTLQDTLLGRFPNRVTRDQVMAWVNGTGLPADAVRPVSDAFDAVDAVRSAWFKGDIAAKKLHAESWAAPQWRYFLDGLPAGLSKARMIDLDQGLDFGKSPNAELAQGWFMAVIRAQYQPAYVRLEEYLESVGREDLILPLYAELMKSPAGAAQARRVFAAARPAYQAATTSAVTELVEPGADGEGTDE